MADLADLAAALAELKSVNVQLRRQNALFDTALNKMSQGLCFFDGAQRLIVCNARYAQMYGLPPELTQPGTEVRSIVEHRYRVGACPEMTQDEYLAWRDRIASADLASETTTRLKDGRVILIHHSPMSDGGWVATHEEITARVQAEEALAEQNDWFEAAIGNMAQGLCLFDSDERLLVCNQRYGEMFKLPQELMEPGTHVQQILDHQVKAGTAPLRPYDDTPVSSFRFKTSQIFRRDLQDGRTLQISHEPMARGGWVATIEDVTESIRAEAKISHLAHHDALTGLANRVLLREKLDDALARARRGEAFAVLCLDLDFFKSVNDTLGHTAGDQLLREVAARILTCVREVDLVARLGGDEFAILQAGIENGDSPAILADRLVTALGQPFEIEGHQVTIGVSVGIALAPAEGLDPEMLLKNADLALYRAKAEGRQAFRYFESAMDITLKERQTLERDLRQALANHEFEVFYQPLVNLESGELCGCEALIRWRHPQRGLLLPADFIALAEEIGLIVPIGDWVLRQACAEAATWPSDIRIAVNLSAAQLKNKALVRSVEEALAGTGLAATRLELEMTESVLLLDSSDTISTLHRLRDLGVRISLDDFGTGYSSLSYLRSFPFDNIKIDRSFVRDLSDRQDCEAIIGAVAALGASLGMATTVEGVETEDQLRRIRNQGCTDVQGFLFGKPCPAAEIERVIAARFSAALGGGREAKVLGGSADPSKKTDLAGR